MDRISKRYSLFCLVLQAVSEAGKHKEDTKKGARAHKGEKIPIISSSDTTVDPYTMVVLSFYAAVADSAMVTSWWPPNVACLAVLCRDVHGAIWCPGRLYGRPLCRRWPQSEWVFGFLGGR